MELILNILIFLPIVAATVMLFLPRFIGKEEAQSKYRWIALFATGTQLLLVGYFYFFLFDPSVQLGDLNSPYSPYNWIEHFNIKYYVVVDGLSMPMVILTALLSFLCIIYSWNETKRPLGYFSLFLLLNAGMMGVFMALDFFLFYIFWEVMLLPMYFLIGMWGGPQRKYAAIKFFLYTLLGSIFMLIGMIALYNYLPDSDKTFNLIQLISLAPSIEGILWGLDIKIVIWVCLFIGFAIKVPIFPFHTWLPLAHVEAPTSVSVILAGVLLKMGTYGLLRISYPLLPGQLDMFAVMLGILAVINIIWGALNAIAQIDLKKMVAYSSISHMGYCLLGMAAVIGTSSPEGQSAGLNGAVMQMFNHGTITAMLFFLVGYIYDRTHHRWIVYPSDHQDEKLAGQLGFGGLSSIMPVYSGFVALAFFAGLGLPALSGFISEAMCFIGGFSVDKLRIITAIGTLGILFNAIYFLRAYQRMFMGKANESYASLEDISNREIGILIPLTFLVILFGVYPQPLIDIISGTMDTIIGYFNA